MIHGRPREPAPPLTQQEWEILVRLAIQRFVCEPEWSEWDFIVRILNGTARPKAA